MRKVAGTRIDVQSAMKGGQAKGNGNCELRKTHTGESGFEPWTTPLVELRREADGWSFPGKHNLSAVNGAKSKQ